jgi:hypothetical protein
LGAYGGLDLGHAKMLRAPPGTRSLPAHTPAPYAHPNNHEALLGLVAQLVSPIQPRGTLKSNDGGLASPRDDPLLDVAGPLTKDSLPSGCDVAVHGASRVPLPT